MGKLTVVGARNAKPGRHADGLGLYLLVKPTLAKSWLLRVQVAGQRRDIGLGIAHGGGLDDAGRRIEAFGDGQKRCDLGCGLIGHGRFPPR